MQQVGGKMDAAARRDRGVLAVGVENAFAFEDVDDLVVDVAVLGCPTRRDVTAELGYVAAADLVRDEVAKFAVTTCRKRWLIRLAYRPPRRCFVPVRGGGRGHPRK